MTKGPKKLSAKSCQIFYEKLAFLDNSIDFFLSIRIFS